MTKPAVTNAIAEVTPRRSSGPETALYTTSTTPMVSTAITAVSLRSDGCLALVGQKISRKSSLIDTTVQPCSAASARALSAPGRTGTHAVRLVLELTLCVVVANK